MFAPDQSGPCCDGSDALTTTLENASGGEWVAAEPRRAHAWWMVAVLSAGSIVSALDRQVINLLVDPLRAALHMSDEQIAILQGFSIAAFFALMGLPLSRFADAGNRRNLILVGALLWSAASCSCGFAQGFAALLAFRSLVGVGEATLTPAGFSMIGDSFPVQGLARPISVFTGAGFLGTGLALIAGGALLSWLRRVGGLHVPGLGRLADWQAAFVLAAAPGLLFAVFLSFVREPSRRGPEAPQSAPLTQVFGFVRRRAGLIGPLFLGFSTLAAGQYALGSWIPTFFIRTYGWPAGPVGISYGLLVALGGCVGVTGGGFLCDHLRARGWGSPNLSVAIGATLLAVPFAAAFPFASSPQAALALILPIALLGPMPFGAGIAAIPAATPSLMRAQVVALYLFIGNLVGLGGGTFLVAFVTDRVVKDPALIRYSLAMVGPCVLLIGAAALAAAVRPFRRAMQEV